MNSQIKLNAGDVFLVESGSIISPVTNFFQKLWSRDNRSKYCHAGIIIDDTNTTLECRWTVCSTNFMEFYKDKDVLIARCENLKNIDFTNGLLQILKFKGQWFPVHRMILHAFHLAKFIHWQSVVCSELVAKYLHGIGTRHNYWWGTTVDDLEEELKNWKQYSIVYEGKL